MNSKPIGIMDSGVGGLSTCIEVRRSLPKESIISYGDLLYMPYGQKTQEFLTQRVSAICTHLEKLGCKAIIIACNTASTVILNHPEAFSHIKIPIFNVITSMVDYLKSHNTSAKLFTILATQATIDSRVYEKKLSESFPNAQIKGIAAIEWASLVESVPLDSKEMEEGIQKYLPEIQNAPSNQVLLACTHFYYLEDILKKKIPQAQFTNTSTPVVQDLKSYLETHHLTNDATPVYRVLASKNSDIFEKMARETFENPNLTVELSEVPL